MNNFQKTLTVATLSVFSFSCSSLPSSRMLKSIGLGCAGGLLIGAAIDYAADQKNKQDKKKLQNQIGNLFKQQKSKPENKGKIIGLGAGCLAGLGVGYYLDTMYDDMNEQLKADGMSLEKIQSGGETKELLIKAGDGALTFEPNAAKLTPTSAPRVKKIADALDGYPETKVRLTGHVSDSTASEFNTKLSQDRAESVKSQLISEGVSSSQITEAVGKGVGAPLPGVAPADSRNRRVEIYVSAKE